MFPKKEKDGVDETVVLIFTLSIKVLLYESALCFASPRLLISVKQQQTNLAESFYGLSFNSAEY